MTSDSDPAAAPPASAAPPAPDPRARAILRWIVLVAFLVRAIGAFGQGAPHGYYGDETSAVERALYFGAMGTADPGWFNKPALTYYLNFCVAGVIFVGGRVLGLWKDTLDFGAFAAGNLGPFLVAGRLLNALFGAGTTWLVYLIGRRLRDRTTGLAAAAAFALVPGDFLAARVLKEDAATSFFMTGALYLLLDVSARGRFRDYLRAGFVGGVAMAAKYYAAALAIPAAFAHLFRAPENATPRGSARGYLLPVLAVAAFGAGFFAGSPYNFLNPLGFGHFRGALDRVLKPAAERPLLAAAACLAIVFVGLYVALRGGRRAGAAGSGEPPSGGAGGAGGAVAAGGFALGVQFEAYGRMTDTAGTFSLAERVLYGLKSATIGNVDAAGGRYGGLGTALTILAVIGIALALRRRRRGEAPLLVAAAGYVLFVAAAGRQMPEPRHLVAVYPCAAFFVGAAVVAIARATCRGAGEGVVRAAALGVLVAAGAAPTPDPVPHGGSLFAAHWTAHAGAYAADTRTMALTFVERHAPPGATVLNFHDAVPLRIGPARAKFMADRQRGIAPGDPRNHQRGYARKWAMIEKSSERPGRPVFDVLSIIVPWQGEDGSPEGRAKSNEGFQNYWPIAAATTPADVPPVERYRRVPWTGDPAADRALGATWGAAPFLLPATKVDWLVVAEGHYNNYVRPEKRARFPDFAAFFDDLKAHYDAVEWAPGPGRTGPRMRVYDLRRRRDDGSAQVARL